MSTLKNSILMSIFFTMFIIFVELVIMRMLPILNPMVPWITSEILNITLLCLFVLPMLFIVVRRFKLVSTVASEQQVQLKLFVVTGFPLAIALVYIISSVIDKTDKLYEYQHYEESKSIETSLGHIVAELQKEREIAAFYIHGYKDTDFNEWQYQILKTDNQLIAFQQSLSLVTKKNIEKRFVEQIPRLLSITQELNKFRDDISGLRIQLDDSLNFYSSLI